MEGLGHHRPRNVGWHRAAALLYGDWGTSKAYVLGFAFTAPILGANGYSSLPIIIAVCALTALVGYNYILVCRHFPDGGGVYSAARDQSRLVAVIGALLLVANFAVTAAMSGWAAMTYLGIPKESVRLFTLLLVIAIGVMNYFGPKHSGSFAVFLAVPMVFAVAITIILSAPHFTARHLQPPPQDLNQLWLAFTWSILALSGVEAVANLTGVMQLDRGSSMDNPRVENTATKAIIVVALEVVIGTSLLGWAMLSLPPEIGPVLKQNYDNVLRVLAREFGTLAFGIKFGSIFGLVVGVIVGLLLLSAVNTGVAALIGLFYMMARDGEMPRAFTRLNGFGVPWFPLGLAIAVPFLVTSFAEDLNSLAGLYAIGVVGAIAVNLGSCSINKRLPLRWHQRAVMLLTFLILAAVELTIAKTRQNALFFAVLVLMFGLALRTWSQRKAGLRTLTVSEELAAAVAPDVFPDYQLKLDTERTIFVAARGMTPVLRFALEEAHLRKATLYILYVKELAVALPGPVMHEAPRWQDDKQASAIMYPMLHLGKQHDVSVIPLYAVSDNPAGTILDLAATFGVDLVMLGASHRKTLVGLLKGNVVTEVAQGLPESIQLVIYG